jgi:hypothetical protein
MTGHSADVEMQLLLNGTSVSIAQLGPDFVILDALVEQQAPADAEILLRVDESERRLTVFLPEGIGGERKKVRIAERAAKQRDSES